MLPIWEEYSAFHRRRDVARSHQKLHESHYSFLDPDVIGPVPADP